MRPLRTPSLGRAGLTLALLICLILPGCFSRIPLPPEDTSRWAERSKIYLTLNDGSEYMVGEPSLQDSVITGSFSPGDRREVGLDEIASLSVSELDRTRTIGLAVWGLTAVVILVTLLGDGDDQEPCPT